MTGLVAISAGLELLDFLVITETFCKDYQSLDGKLLHKSVLR